MIHRLTVAYLSRYRFTDIANALAKLTHRLAMYHIYVWMSIVYCIEHVFSVHYDPRMPRRVTISRVQMDWLHSHHARTTYAQMARKLGVNVDTLKRILQREGLREFEGAKYQLSRENTTAMWDRPCMACGDTKSRPRHWYYCVDCRLANGWEADE